jgi:hypothetical protein
MKRLKQALWTQIESLAIIKGFKHITENFVLWVEVVFFDDEWWTNITYFFSQLNVDPNAPTVPENEEDDDYDPYPF